MVMALMPFTVCALDIKDVIKEVRMKYVPDSRQDIFDVKCVEKQGNVVIEGVTTRADAKEALIVLTALRFFGLIVGLRSLFLLHVSVPTLGIPRSWRPRPLWDIRYVCLKSKGNGIGRVHWTVILHG